jgi:hypothetical protein
LFAAGAYYEQEKDTAEWQALGRLHAEQHCKWLGDLEAAMPRNQEMDTTATFGRSHRSNLRLEWLNRLQQL